MESPIILPDYKDDADAYEREETARPDEMLMVRAVSEAAQRIADLIPGCKVLDLCCGTGLPLLGLAEHPNVTELVGVDISEPYLAFARRRFLHLAHVQFLNGDAVTTPLPRATWDVITMASAYHHIDDARKLEFLKRVASLLGPNGIAVVGENILPFYEKGSRTSYANAVRFFYEEVLSTAEENEALPDEVRGLIQRVAQYGFDGEYEYKTDIDIFLELVGQAGLTIKTVRKVWPNKGRLCMTTGGNYVFQLTASRQETGARDVDA